MNLTLRGAVLSVLLLGPTAFAGDDTQRAREEVERQLRELVQIPAAKVAITYVSLDEPNLKLDGAEFVLDGKTVASPSGDALSAPGEHPVWEGELPDGRHELIARLTWVDTSSVLISEQAGYKWKVSAAVRFETERGLEVRVRTLPERDGSERDLRKQMKVKFDRGLVMLAKVDTSVPPPPERPKLVVAAAEPPEVEQPRPAPAPRDEFRPTRKKRTTHHRVYRRRGQQVAQVAEAREVRPAASRGAEALKVEPAVAKVPAERTSALEPATAQATAAPRAEDDAGSTPAPAGVAERAGQADAAGPAEAAAPAQAGGPAEAAAPVEAPDAGASAAAEQKAKRNWPVVPVAAAAAFVILIVAVTRRRRKG